MLTHEIDISLPFLEAVTTAGKAILNVYVATSGASEADLTAVMDADRISNDLISRFLKQHYSFPILTGEGKEIPYGERREWDFFWLLEPLDGHKEFINRTGDFTINVALIQGENPVIGAIYAPVRDLLYYAVKGRGSFRVQNGVTIRLPLIFMNRKKQLTVLGTNSHETGDFEKYVLKLHSKDKDIPFVAADSSLKFCMVAEGTAHLYPRLGPSMEWHTAAGQVIVEEAGGRVVEAGNNKPLRYNKPNLKNPHFIVTGRAHHDYA